MNKQIEPPKMKMNDQMLMNHFAMKMKIDLYA